MRIVLTHPFCWPYVRRGSERFIAEFARFLSDRGHEVVTISSRLGTGTTEDTPDGRRILHRQRWRPAFAKLRLTPMHTFVPSLVRSLLQIDADVVHSLAYLDTCAANALRRRRRFRTVLQVTGPPVPYWLPRVPPDRYLVGRAMRSSDRCMVHSEFNAQITQEFYGFKPHVIPVPIDIAAFPLKDGPVSERPRILSVASFDDRRKGVRVLIRAFELLKRELPDALLRLSGQLSDALRREVLDPLPPALRQDIEVLGVGELEDLPRLYREASVTVLPSMWEAYGMSIVESWACGTPVAVTAHGGLKELVDDPALGRTFDPQTTSYETTNAQGLADAIRNALPLDQDRVSRSLRRARAEARSWDRIGPRYEELYDGF
ncbi:MAG: glycosyltransferase family 4 protein [Phycisphaerae bacterium]